MDKGITTTSSLTIGLDLGDRFTAGSVVDGFGELVEAFRFRTTPLALDRALSRFGLCRVVLEVGTHSPWVSRRVPS